MIRKSNQSRVARDGRLTTKARRKHEGHEEDGREFQAFFVSFVFPSCLRGKATISRHPGLVAFPDHGSRPFAASLEGLQRPLAESQRKGARSWNSPATI